MSNAVENNKAKSLLVPLVVVAIIVGAAISCMSHGVSTFSFVLVAIIINAMALGIAIVLRLGQKK